MPAWRSFSSMVRVKSGASMPMNTSGFSAIRVWISNLRRLSSSRRRPNTSTKPMTARRSMGK
ncbi:hypothetical protein D3C71_2058660 [compost metagenome]